LLCGKAIALYRVEETDAAIGIAARNLEEGEIIIYDLDEDTPDVIVHVERILDAPAQGDSV